MDDKNQTMFHFTASKPLVSNFVFAGKEGGIDTLTLTPDGFVYKGNVIQDAGEAHRMFKAALEGKLAESAATQALRLIREAGHNFGAWATWAQRTAAWGMEPTKWPKQSEEAPPNEPNIRSLEALGHNTTLSVAAHLAQVTVLPHVVAFNVAPALVKIVLDDLKKGEA